ncbi:MAG TPA: S1C family serine protease [Chthoniobacteraceae bacterium]|nr:S1C family serine protease [Chthoniobacteraceae bacterium]
MNGLTASKSLAHAFARTSSGPLVLRFRSIVAASTAAAALVCASRAEPADDAGVLASIDRQVRAVFEKCRAAVVRIEASDAHGRLSGTGFFIDPNGTLYTSYSVGGESHDIVVHLGDERLPATRKIGDLRSGIAILKVEAGTPFLAFGNSRDLAVASPVMTIGYPFDLPASPSFGMIGGRDIKYLGRYFATEHIRANVPVQRGQGGAPLLNLRGEVVGILISSLDQGSASFALPIEAAEKVRKDFLRFREVRRGWLGIEVGTLDAPLSGSTAFVKDVLPDSPALKAGVRQGDVLVRVGDRAITSPDDVRDVSFFLTADDSTTLRLARGSETLDLSIQPADHPEESSALKRIAPAFMSGPDLAVPLDKDE